jgi:hypothetical protein
MLRLLVLVWAMAGGAALAQTTTGSVNPNPPASQPAAKDDVPPGGCMPMGVTASGEIVFPLECKAFLEQHRGNDPTREPSAAEAKPSLGPKPQVDAKPPTVDAKPLEKDAPAAVEPPVATPQKSAARDEVPFEKQPEASVEKPPETAVPKQAEAPAPKEPEIAAPKEPEVPAAKETATEAAKESEPASAAKEPEPPVQKQSEAVAPEDSHAADTPVKSSSSSKRAEEKHAEEVPRLRPSRSPDCTGYRTYNAASRSYRDFSGHQRPCR